MDLILLSGGLGKRAKLNYPKQLMRLGGKPMLIYVLEIFRKVKNIGKIIITVPENIKYYDELLKSYGIKNVNIIIGGKTRQESVYFALLQCSGNEVIIHESVRPFINFDFLDKLIHTESENVVPIIGNSETMYDKRFGYLKRENIYRIQLPQKFNLDKLLLAHTNARESNLSFTDDSSLYNYYFTDDIVFINGLEENIKITTPLDIQLAFVIYKSLVEGDEL